MIGQTYVFSKKGCQHSWQPFRFSMVPLKFYQDNVLPQGEGFGWNPNMSIRLGQFRLIVGDGDHFTVTRTRPDIVA